MMHFPLYNGNETCTWTWRDIKNALVGNTQRDIDRIEAEFLLDDDAIRIQGPKGLEWHISGTTLLNNSLWGDAITEKPWWREYEDYDARMKGNLSDATNFGMAKWNQKDI